MEFDETDEFGSLMRQNTAITRMMSTYTRYLLHIKLLFHSFIVKIFDYFNCL